MDESIKQLANIIEDEVESIADDEFLSEDLRLFLENCDSSDIVSIKDLIYQLVNDGYYVKKSSMYENEYEIMKNI